MKASLLLLCIVITYIQAAEAIANEFSTTSLPAKTVSGLKRLSEARIRYENSKKQLIDLLAKKKRMLEMFYLRQLAKGDDKTGSDGKYANLKELSEARRLFSNGRKQIDSWAEKTRMLETLQSTKKN